MGRKKVKEEIKQGPEDQVTEDVQGNGKPETTEGAKAEATAEATAGVSGSASGSDQLPIEIAPIEQPSSSPPAITFQPETFLPAPLQFQLGPSWNAPINWGLDEWVEQADLLGYWQDQFGRVDALLTKRRGEALWHCWDWFRQRRIQIKKEGKRLKDEPVTWRKLMAKKKWDPASTSRRIRFYLDHKDTPDDQLSGETIVNMWNGRHDHEQDPPALGSCWQCRQNHLLEFCDEQGVLTSKQGHVKEGTILEVINFRDWNQYQDTLVRIRTGIHTGKHLRMRGAELSHLPSIPLEKVPPLQQAIEDARPKKTKPKGKSTGKGSHPVVEPPADAPIWVLKDNATKVQLVKPFNGVFKFENNKADLFLHERVKVCCEHNDQTVCQVVMPHGFRLFRVSIASFREHFTLEKHPQPEAAQEARTEGQQASQESEHVQHQPALEPEPVISEAVKEALAFLESYLSVIWSIENPTENEYLLLRAKLDEVIQAMDDLWDRVPDATAQDEVIDAEVIECSTETPS